MRVWCVTGKSGERAAQDEGPSGEMAAEWDGLMAARRCEAYGGRVSRKIFLREMKMYRGDDG